MVELQEREIPYNFIFSGQHQATIHNIRNEFGLKAPDINLYSGKDITGIFQMVLWSIRIIAFSLYHRHEVWKGDKNGIVLNHGDTFSTLLGSLLARVCGQRSAHVESGLRSFNFFHPFPEEITRVLTFHLSNIYFAPGERAMENLRKYRGTKVNTMHNTLLDALKLSRDRIAEALVEIPEGPYGLVSIHRFENIFSRSKLSEIVDLLMKISGENRLLFILHKPTDRKLEEFDLISRLSNNDNIELRPRYSYFEFIKLTEQASFVITDGGSNQEECYYMGKPCIIMRAASERQEGLGDNAIISNYEYSVINRAINELQKKETYERTFDISPAAEIVNHLVKMDA